ncbi:hypothetical protein DFP72DRAFT_1172727 [Ephemerocybe angulata]|uniref:Uncharacterized protein n=1 Tax=Ephemerocybe angulata TaxID=980116 RepID=A0A8H6HQL2_9AGAR|nr:hypothetical protein DFP72DRAFT_1172727 [Tulosesus angulatus]
MGGERGHTQCALHAGQPKASSYSHSAKSGNSRRPSSTPNSISPSTAFPALFVRPEPPAPSTENDDLFRVDEDPSRPYRGTQNPSPPRARAPSTWPRRSLPLFLSSSAFGESDSEAQALNDFDDDGDREADGDYQGESGDGDEDEDESDMEIDEDDVEVPRRIHQKRRRRRRKKRASPTGKKSSASISKAVSNAATADIEERQSSSSKKGAARTQKRPKGDEPAGLLKGLKGKPRSCQSSARSDVESDRDFEYNGGCLDVDEDEASLKAARGEKGRNSGVRGANVSAA